MLGTALVRAVAADPTWQQTPLGLRNQHPLALVHSTLRFDTPAVLETGRWGAKSSFLWSNTLNYRQDAYYIDAESRIWENYIAYAPAQDIEIGAILPLLWRGGGRSDSFLEEWDETLGLSNRKRKRLPQDQYLIRGENHDGSIYQFDHRGTAFGDIVLRTKYLLPTKESGGAAALFLDLGLPTGADEYGQDGVDLLCGALASWQLEFVSFFLGGGGSYFSDVQEAGLEYRRYHAAGFLGFAFAVTESVEFLTNTSVSSAFVESARNFPNYELYLDLGVRMKAGEKMAFFLGVRENPANPATSTDATIVFSGSAFF